MAGQERSLRVGLFGGTFDPVHEGHLTLARHVRQRCRLDRVLFIPAQVPPHKRQPAASFEHRAAMLKAALEEADEGQGLLLSLIEGQLPRPSYTIRTLEALQRERGGDRFFLIIGIDMLFDLPHWHRAEELLDLADLIVVRRGRHNRESIDRAILALHPGLTRTGEKDLWLGDQGRTVQYLDDIDLPVSSSAIRAELASGGAAAMLPAAVLRYIRAHHLYTGPGQE